MNECDNWADVERCLELDRLLERINNKPVVTFRTGRLINGRALLFQVRNHPRLGSGSKVMTSRIMSQTMSGGSLVRVETKNTIYRKVGPDKKE